MLSPHAKSEWTTILVIGLLLSATAILAGWWWLSIPLIIATLGLMLFFRDPDRPIPTQRGIMVSPADGKVSSIHEVEFFEPFNGPAICVRIFLSVFDVHINRSPIHGVVTSITHKPGEHLNVLNPKSAEVNEYNLLIFAHPIRRDIVAAVRQVAGLCARTICCTINTGAVIQRGQRIGIIKLGSTTELYIPARFNPQVIVEQGQYVYGGTTILANVNMGPTLEDEEYQEGQTQPTTVEENTNDTASQETVTLVDTAQQPEVLDATESEQLADEVTINDEQLEEENEQATDSVDAIDEDSSEDTPEAPENDPIETDADDEESEEELVDDDDDDDDEEEEEEATDANVQELVTEEEDDTEVEEEDQDQPDEEPQSSSDSTSDKKKSDDDDTPMLF
ncbi:MAG: phosphatidylserine decarboxylase family protein [Phycisphaeraceae bacterium]|nr:phosphatidylserine decarboxylase family protein [Phycisphaeraceae bacterium]